MLPAKLRRTPWLPPVKSAVAVLFSLLIKPEPSRSDPTAQGERDPGNTAKIRVLQSKGSFAQQQLKYLGHIVSAQGVSTDPDKIATVQKYPIPQSTKDLRSFLGLAGYYRRFIRNFGVIAKPLYDLLKKGVQFTWNHETDQAFLALKQALFSAPVLALPNFQIPFTVVTDALDKGIGAVLEQGGHPIAFLSRALSLKNQGMSTYEKESLAILMAIDHWRSYLQPTEFIIQTDHKGLINLDDQRLHTYWQHKVMIKLMGLQYRIWYKKGSNNGAADALSRMPNESEVTVASVSVSQPVWLQELQDSYSQSKSASKLLAELTLHYTQGHFSLNQGVIKYKGRFWLGHNSALQQQVMNNQHAGAIGGHSGLLATYTRIKNLFAWPHMKVDIHKFVTECAVCRQAKVKRVPTLDYFNLLQFLIKLGRLTHPFTALQVAKAYMEHVYKLHGMPVVLISDRDRIFTSHLWQELFKLSGTDLRMSSAYHPQSDGQTDGLIGLLLLSSGTTLVLYGHEPRHFSIVGIESCSVPDLAEWLRDRKLMQQLLQQQLVRVQQRMKHQADKKRIERVFEVGDHVWLKLQLYVQMSVARRSNHKLAYHYFGPYEIEKKIGSMAYKLKLPEGSSVHLVFHVSLLKCVVPEMVLDRLLHRHGNVVTPQVLVKWSGWLAELAT
ncbi:hypothetical protein U9M48_035925 [Paspalum notatum var. saurae]|uniref:Integrase catalytic domain-containing protein n=1 Tax=Paspalum notatum var. saurae TaxID=547442 RepID=A0AAQ3X823_PASNO